MLLQHHHHRTLVHPLRQASRLGLLALATLMALMQQAQAEVSGQTVDRIKAAYIYNFAKFIELPSPDDKTLRLCVIGKDDLNGALQALQHRIAQGREMVVRKDMSVDQLKDCAMVFVSESDARSLTAAARQVGGAPVLVISDARQAMDHGAHLALIFNDDRVEFDVNLAQLQKSGIKASSQMLKLARTVLR